jgi:tRNA (adenine22-N1)-methyltransferase
MELTPRLQAIAALVPQAESMADIGTDHAYIPMELVRSGRVKQAVASDINEGPVRMARDHIRSEGLADRIDVRLGSGLATLTPGECDGVVIAGMGGLLISQILAADEETARSLRWMVLQPMNHAGDLRQWLSENGYRVEKESLAREEWHIYDIMRVVPGESRKPDPLEAEVGVTEDRLRDPLFPEHIKKLMISRKAVLSGIPADTANAENRQKRQKAAEELKRLEAWLCQ